MVSRDNYGFNNNNHNNLSDNILYGENMRELLYEVVPKEQKYVVDSLIINYSRFNSINKEKLKNLLKTLTKDTHLNRYNDNNNNINNYNDLDLEDEIYIEQRNREDLRANSLLNNISLNLSINGNNNRNRNILSTNLNRSVIGSNINGLIIRNRAGDITKDTPNKILARKNESYNKIFYLVEWKSRSDGIYPLNSYVSSSDLRRKYNRLLMNYLENRQTP